MRYLFAFFLLLGSVSAQTDFCDAEQWVIKNDLLWLMNFQDSHFLAEAFVSEDSPDCEDPCGEISAQAVALNHSMTYVGYTDSCGTTSTVNEFLYIWEWKTIRADNLDCGCYRDHQFDTWQGTYVVRQLCDSCPDGANRAARFMPPVLTSFMGTSRVLPSPVQL